MYFDLIVQAVINGVLLGGAYTLMAAGLSLIFGVMRVVNFAHGEMIVVGMYVAFICVASLGLDPYLSWPLAAAALFVVGVMVQRALVDRIIGGPHEIQILLMFGVALVLQNTLLMIFGPTPKTVSSPFALSTIWLGDFFVDVPRLATFLFALAATWLLRLFLHKTDLGRSMRAAADNPYGAKAVGIDVRFVSGVAFGIGAASAGAAGALMVPFVTFQPSLSFPFGLLAFYVVIIGGMGRIAGALYGGLLVAVAESVGAVILSPSLKQLFSFGLFVLILLLRPEGLLGKRAA